jgi:hypothetical protein
MKIAVFWDMAPSSLVKVAYTDVSELHTTSIIRVIVLMKLRSTSTLLHSAIYQKTVIFIEKNGHYVLGRIQGIVNCILDIYSS